MSGLILEGIVLYSADLNRAKSFYRDLLGLPLLLDEDHVIHFDAGSVRLAIHRCPPGEGRQAPEGFAVFAPADLPTVSEDLRRRGADFLGPSPPKILVHRRKDVHGEHHEPL